jgi:hypothetical protein
LNIRFRHTCCHRIPLRLLNLSNRT